METGQANLREGAGGKPPEEELSVPFSPLLCQVASVINSFVTLWIVAHQAPLSMGFSRKEYWPGLLCPPPRDISNPGIEPTSLTSPALAGRFFTTSATWEALLIHPRVLKGLWQNLAPTQMA